MNQEEYNEAVDASITEYANAIMKDFPKYDDLLVFHIENQVRMEIALVEMYNAGKKLGHKIGFAMATVICLVAVIATRIF